MESISAESLFIYEDEEKGKHFVDTWKRNATGHFFIKLSLNRSNPVFAVNANFRENSVTVWINVVTQIEHVFKTLAQFRKRIEIFDAVLALPRFLFVTSFVKIHFHEATKYRELSGRSGRTREESL